MRKLFLLALMLVASFSMSARNVPAGYVDLGLPSGTMWKATNEPGQYMFLTAQNQFGANLPSREQCNELFANCSCQWAENMCIVTGPNGNKISFSYEGLVNCNEERANCGEHLSDAGEADFLFVVGRVNHRAAKIHKKSKTHNTSLSKNCNRLSVHLVCK